MLQSPPCDDTSQAVALAPLGNATEDTTWVLTSVRSQYSRSTFGFIANITSLDRLNGNCAANNASSLGVHFKPLPPGGIDFDTCYVDDGAFLKAGAEVNFEFGVRSGGWALLPVSPTYCFGPFMECTARSACN